MTTLVMRGWPGRMPRQLGPVQPSAPLARRDVWQLLHVASDRANPGAFGLAVWHVETRDGSSSVLVVPDDLSDRARAILARVAGPSYRLLRLSEWLGLVALEAEPAAFVAAYRGPRKPPAGNIVVAWDLGRTLGLLAEHWSAGDTITVWPAGWGRRTGRGRLSKVSPHQPPLQLEERPQGWHANFAAPRCDKHEERGDYGVWLDRKPYRGEFVDLASWAYALLGDRGNSYNWFRAKLGLGTAPLVTVVDVSPLGVAQVIKSARGLLEVARACDTENQQWFAGGPAPDAVVSPAGLAQQLLQRAGVAQPLLQYDLSHPELAAWMENLRGGWQLTDPLAVGQRLQVVGRDIKAAYPLAANLIGWWELMTAETLARKDVTAEVRALAESAARDPSVLFDRGLWASLGATLVEVRPTGGPLFAGLRAPDGQDRSLVVPLYAGGRTFSWPWPDVVAAAVAGGRAPEIVRATRLSPQGRQSAVRQSVQVRPGLRISLDADPLPKLVRLRSTAPALKLVTNALVWGNPARFDSHRRGKSTTETPGPYCFPPLAATVSAGVRLIATVYDRLVAEAGGRSVYGDTDSRYVVDLTADAVAAIADRFAGLSPDPANWPVWAQLEATQLRILGPKKYRTAGPDGRWQGKDTGLGGTYLPPPGNDRRGADGWDWVQAWHRDAEVGRPTDDLYYGFPALRRHQVGLEHLRPQTPLRRSLEAIGARPGAYYLTATAQHGGDRLMTLDRGDGGACWADVPWLDTVSGEWVRLGLVGGLSPSDEMVRVPEMLGDKLGSWARPPHRPPTEVHATHVEFRGRVSAGIDAYAAGLPEPESHRPHYGTERIKSSRKPRPRREIAVCWCQWPGCDQRAGTGRRSDAHWCAVHSARGRKKASRGRLSAAADREARKLVDDVEAAA